MNAGLPSGKLNDGFEIQDSLCMRNSSTHFLYVSLLLFFAVSCNRQQEHTAPAIYDRDSVAMMTSYGVNTLISDSGVIKYRVVAEQWEVNDKVNPSRSIFEKGVFLTQFDDNFHIQAYIQCDTAYNYDKLKLWKLRGRVRILTKDGLRYYSEELYWDERRHELYSNVYSRLVTPERDLEGSYFRSDERMTKYYVANSKGSFEKDDFEKDDDDDNVAREMQEEDLRPQASPHRRTRL